MNIDFEPTRSFCYRFTRYQLLPELQLLPEATSGEPFLLRELARPLIDKFLTIEQQAVMLKRKESEEYDSVLHIVKFYVPFLTKELGLFVSEGGGYFRAKTDADISEESVAEAALQDGDEEVGEFEGWIYAFSFPALVNPRAPFPIKIGKTIGDVDARVMSQCKGSASFDNPVILGKWQVAHVGPTELAIHNILKARGKWREHAPGTEWFDTTLEEIEQTIRFI